MIKYIICFIRGHTYPIDEESFELYLEYGYLTNLYCTRCGREKVLRMLS